VGLIKHMSTHFFQCSVICICLSWALPSPAKTQMLFVTPDNCKLIKGYSKHDLQGVAQAYKVPASKVNFVKDDFVFGQAVPIPGNTAICH
jgi:hypothetical protein